MVKDAEAHAEEDRQRREEAETRNQAETLVYQTEKFVKDNDEKLPADVKDKVNAALTEANEALKGNDIATIRTAMEKLATESQAMGTALYAQAQASAGCGTTGAVDDDVVDEEFESVMADEPVTAFRQSTAGPRAPVDRERIFLCHSHGDKEVVRDLYGRLRADGFNPWLDEEDLLPGHDWEFEIRKALRTSRIVLVCLSASSTVKRGFVQREIRFALDVADQQPEGSIYLIPVRIEPCDVPHRLDTWQWVDLFTPGGYGRLLQTLRRTILDQDNDGTRSG
jgi:TIR domain/Hsp70 protein